MSARDSTPVKNSVTTDITLRDAARKRLSLTDTRQSEFSSQKNRKVSSSEMSLNAISTSREQSNDNFVNRLQGLSHEQLVQLIIELVYAQENGTLCENEKLRNVLLNKMPAVDIQPLIDKLKILKQNVYTNFIFCSNVDDNSIYSHVSMHMDAFQVCISIKIFVYFVLNISENYFLFWLQKFNCNGLIYACIFFYKLATIY